MNNKEESLFDLSKLTKEEILKKLNSSFDGLTDEMAQHNLKKFGLNQITDSKKLNFFARFINSFANPLIILLIILVIVSYLIKENETALIIAIMVIISTIISFIQESSASKAAEKLQEMVSLTTTVVRKIEKEIPTRNVVIGDIVKLSAGHIIPADLRIISSNNLYINQSTLTGESMPVEKNIKSSDEDKANLFELKNICFMGSYVSSGTALAVVISTGNNTYFGKLAESVSKKKDRTAFDKGFNQFTWLMIRFMLISVPLVFIINILTKGDIVHAFLFSLAVTVSLTPEMLPMIVTVNLAKGAMLLSKQKVIVKKLCAIQNLVAINILCSDKTGTFFANIALPTDNVDKNDLISPKPWNIKGIEKTMFFLGLCISVFDFILFGAMIFIFDAWDNEKLFQTGWFVDYVTIQVLTLHVVRTSKISFINSIASSQLIISHILVLLAVIWLTLSPIGKVLNLTSLPPYYWFILLIISLGFLIVSNLIKHLIEKKD